MKIDTIIFDFAGTLVKMRPATLLIDRLFLSRLFLKYKLAILTGGSRPEVVNVLSKLNIKDYFPDQNIITKSDTNLRKPDSRLLKLIIKKIKATNPIYTGDDSKDFNMAKSAKVPFIFSDKLLSSRRLYE